MVNWRRRLGAAAENLSDAPLLCVSLGTWRSFAARTWPEKWAEADAELDARIRALQLHVDAHADAVPQMQDALQRLLKDFEGLQRDLKMALKQGSEQAPAGDDDS